MPRAYASTVLLILAAGVAPCTTFFSHPLPTAVNTLGARPEACSKLPLTAEAVREREAAAASPLSRRAALRNAAVGASGAWLVLGGGHCAAAESDAAGNRVVPEDNIEFQAQWRYAKAQDILPYIYATAKQGNVGEILRSMDEFGRHYPMYKLGDEKGEILEREIAQMDSPPKNAVYTLLFWLEACAVLFMTP
jgi:hypothetical protein